MGKHKLSWEEMSPRSPTERTSATTAAVENKGMRKKTRPRKKGTVSAEKSEVVETTATTSSEQGDSEPCSSSSLKLPKTQNATSATPRHNQQSEELKTPTHAEEATFLLCSVCIDTFNSPVKTKCGHTFCKDCLCSVMEYQNKCPTCGEYINESNLQLDLKTAERASKWHSVISTGKLIEEVLKATSSKNCPPTEIVDILSKPMFLNTNQLSVQDFDSILKAAKAASDAKAMTGKQTENSLAEDFLMNLLTTKQLQKEKLEKEIAVINANLHLYYSDDAAKMKAPDELMSKQENDDDNGKFLEGSKHFAVGPQSNNPSQEQSLPFHVSKQRMQSLLPELSTIYNGILSETIFCAEFQNTNNSDHDLVKSSQKRMQEFPEILDNVTKFRSVKSLAAFWLRSRNEDPTAYTNSIKYIALSENRNDYAVCGDSMIKIFSLSKTLESGGGIDFDEEEGSELKVGGDNPIHMVWHRDRKHILASAQNFYPNSSIMLWDTERETMTCKFGKNEGTILSIDWSQAYSDILLATSSSKGVIMWCHKTHKIIHQVASTNAATRVKSSPFQPFEFAIGDTDGCIEIYDSRKTSQMMLHILNPDVDSTKYVNGIEFLDKEHLITITNCGTTTIWNRNEPYEAGECLKTFEPNKDKMNSPEALAANKDYLAVAYDDKLVTFYSPHCTKPMINYEFNWDSDGRSPPVSGFDYLKGMTALAWIPETTLVMAGDSRGILKILELTC